MLDFLGGPSTWKSNNYLAEQVGQMIYYMQILKGNLRKYTIMKKYLSFIVITFFSTWLLLIHL